MVCKKDYIKKNQFARKEKTGLQSPFDVYLLGEN
jgi:hypothetical protein